MDFYFTDEIVQIQNYILDSKYDLAINIIEKIEVTHSIDDIIYIQAQNLRAEIHLSQREYSKALAYLELSDQLNNDRNVYLAIDTIITKLEVFDALKRYDEFSSLLHKFDELIPNVELPLIKDTKKSKIYKIKGLVDVENKEYDSAITNFERSIELGKYDANKESIVSTWQLLSVTHSILGKYDKAIEILNTTLEYADRENLPEFKKYVILSNLGTLYQAIGNLTLAEKTFMSVLEYFESLGQPGIAAGIYKNLGELYYHHGQISKAIIYTSKSIESFKIMNFQVGRMASLLELAKIKYLSNEITGAISILDELFEYREEFRGSLMILEVILFRVLIFCRTDDKTEIEDYINHYEEIKDSEYTHSSKVIVELIEAILSLSRTGIRSKAAALVKLEWIINQKEVNFELKNYSIRFVIEILLMDYKENLSHEIFGEIIQYLTILEEISKKENLYPTMIETMIIRSKFLVIQGKFQESNIILDEAIYLAGKYKLETPKQQIIKEKSRLVDEFQRLKSFVDVNYEFLDDIEKQEFEDYLDSIRKFRVKLKD